MTRFIAWIRLPADLVFIGFVVVPPVIAAGSIYARLFRTAPIPAAKVV